MPDGRWGWLLSREEMSSGLLSASFADLESAVYYSYRLTYSIKCMYVAQATLLRFVVDLFYNKFGTCWHIEMLWKYMC